MSQQRPIGLIGTPTDYWVSMALAALLRVGDDRVPVYLFSSQVSGAAGRASQSPQTEGVRVIPCWSPVVPRYDDLTHAVRREEVSSLHVMSSLRTFSVTAFGRFLQEERARGVEIVIHLDVDDLRDSASRHLIRHASRVVVESAECRHEAAAYGVPFQAISVVEPPLTPLTLSAHEARRLLGSSDRKTIVTAISGNRMGGELKEVVDACRSLIARGRDLQLSILRADPQLVSEQRDYGAEQIPVELAGETWVRFVDDPFPSTLVRYLAASDVIVFPRERPSRAMRFALSAALGSAAPIVAPDRQPFTASSTSGAIVRWGDCLPLSQALTAVLDQEPLRASLRGHANEWREQHQPRDWSTAILGRAAPLRPSKPAPQAAAAPQLSERRPEVSTPEPAAHAAYPSPGMRTPRVLIKAFDGGSGGDAGRLAEMLEQALKSRGMDVLTDPQIASRGFDLVHIIGGGTGEGVEAAARECVAAGVPYIFSPLYGGWERSGQMITAATAALDKYVVESQPRDRWKDIRRATAGSFLRLADLRWTFEHAAMTLAFGGGEANAIRRDYPSAKLIEVGPLAAVPAIGGDGGAAFSAHCNMRDYVLCSGGFSWWNNQLSLLKALEECDLPLVFVGRSSRDDAAYARRCQQFIRRGSTLFLESMNDRLMASAIDGARIAVSAAWFSMPSPVLLAAALRGKNVVLAESGNARDYFGDDAYLCDVGDPDSLHNAVLAAFYAPVRPALSGRASAATTERTARRMIEVYRSILKLRADLEWPGEDASAPTTYLSDTLEQATENAREATHSVERIPVLVGAEPPMLPLQPPAPTDMSMQGPDWKELCDDGDRLARDGDVENARRSYESAAKRFPRVARPVRSLGVLSLQTGALDDAEAYLTRANALEPGDQKTLVGLGAVCWARGDVDGAISRYLAAVEQDPRDKTPILYMVQAGYASGRFGDLETALRKSLQFDPDNQYIQYCLAGCYYRQKRMVLAKSVLERILRIHPDDNPAKELLAKIASEEPSLSPPSPSIQLPGGFRPQPAPPPSAPTRERAALDDLQAKIEIAKRARNYDTVISLCERFEATGSLTDDDRAFVTLVRGEVAACRNDIPTAERLFADAEKSATWRYRAVCGRGALEAAASRWPEAVRLFRQSLELCPEYDVALAGLGVCALERGAQEEAWTFFSRALDRNAGNLRAMYGALQVGYAMNKLEDITRRLEAYLEEHPGDIGMLYSYAGCLFAAGRMTEAEREIEKILLLDPSHELARELQAKMRSPQIRAASAGS